MDIWGRAMIDEQGAMMVCEKLELVDTDTEKYAQEIISDWGVTL